MPGFYSSVHLVSDIHFFFQSPLLKIVTFRHKLITTWYYCKFGGLYWKGHVTGLDKLMKFVKYWLYIYRHPLDLTNNKSFIMFIFNCLIIFNKLDM